MAQKLGIGTAETLRRWVRNAEIDPGERAEVTSEEHADMWAKPMALSALSTAGAPTQKNPVTGATSLSELAEVDVTHPQHLQFSILQVFAPPNAPTAQVDAAEAHFKKVLRTRLFGLNRR